MNFLSVRLPKGTQLQRFLERQARAPLSYAHVGMSEHPEPPKGFSRRATRAHLGHGEAVFGCAVRALQSWAVYPRWMTLYPSGAPVTPGTLIAIGTGWGLYTLSAVRVIDVQAEARRFSFTLGTLPQHALSGEERFCVTWDAADRVVYSVVAVSRPHHPLVRLVAPALRLVQARFAKDSVRSVRSAVARGL